MTLAEIHDKGTRGRFVTCGITRAFTTHTGACTECRLHFKLADMKIKITTTLIALLSSTTLISAQFAHVLNNCTFPVYVQSVPYDSHLPIGALTQLPTKGLYTEPYSQTGNPNGATIKMGTQSALAHPLFFGYSTSTSPNDVYYELKDTFGNPFLAYNVDLGAAAGCASFHCKAGQVGPTCYSTGKTVYACGRPVNTTAVLCASS